METTKRVQFRGHLANLILLLNSKLPVINKDLSLREVFLIDDLAPIWDAVEYGIECGK